MNTHIVNPRKGSITIELLIAFAILTLSLSAVIIVVFGNQSLAVDTQTNNEALYRAQTMLEQARAQSRQDFSSVVSQSAIAEQSGPLTYTKKFDVTDIDAFTKQATSTVAWQLGGRSFSIALTTMLTNPSSAIAIDSCNTVLAGDWKNPQHWDYSATSLVPGDQSNGLGIADVKENKGKLYVAANSLMNNKFKLIVFSLPQDPSQAPTFLGGIDTNPSSSDGLNALSLGRNGAKTYAYIASARRANYTGCSQSANCSQLQIVDVSNPVSSGWNPSIVNLKIPGATGSGGQAIGNAVYYSSGYAYVGLTKTASGPEFNIIDVHDPVNPVSLGSYPVGHTVEAMYVSGNYAYVTTDDNSGTNHQLLVLDISNKSASPLPLATYFKVAGAGYGRTVSVNNSQVLLGRSYANGSPTLYLLNASDLSLSPLPSWSSISGNSNVMAVAGRGTFAFALTSTQFQVWDISIASTPKPWSPDGTTNTFLSLSAIGGSGTTFSCAGNYFYAAVASSQGNHKDLLSIIGPQ